MSRISDQLEIENTFGEEMMSKSSFYEAISHKDREIVELKALLEKQNEDEKNQIDKLQIQITEY